MYKVTGVDVSGRRFKIETNNMLYAMGINLWRGSVWRNESGKWKLVKRVWN